MIQVFAHPYQFTLNRRIWCFILGALAMVLGCLYASGMGLDARGAYMQGVFLIVFAVGALISCYVSRNDVVFFYCHCYAQIMFMYFIGSFFSYLGATLNFPAQDHVLLAMDQALHLNWRSYVEWMDARPEWMIDALKFSYFSFMIQTWLVVSLVFVLNRPDHGQRLVLAVIFSSLVTAFLFTLAPAVGMYGYQHIELGEFTRLKPMLARIQEPLFLALREGSVQTLYYPSQGIIAMPSFHTIMAALFIYASWPFKWARLVVLPNNILLILATPIYGGHYFVDIFAGLLIAFAGIALANKILPKSFGLTIVHKERKPLFKRA